MNARMLEGSPAARGRESASAGAQGIGRSSFCRESSPAEYEGGSKATAAARGLIPFVGREDELLLLINR